MDAAAAFVTVDVPTTAGEPTTVGAGTAAESVGEPSNVEEVPALATVKFGTVDGDPTAAASVGGMVEGPTPPRDIDSIVGATGTTDVVKDAPGTPSAGPGDVEVATGTAVWNVGTMVAG